MKMSIRSSIAQWRSRFQSVWNRVWVWSRVGLSIKMTIIAIIGTVALIFIFAYMGTTALNDNIARLLQERVVLAQTTARHVDYTLATIEHLLAQEADNAGLMDPSRRTPVLRSIFSRMNFFGSQLLLFDQAAQVVVAYPASDVAWDDSVAVQSVLQGAPATVSRQTYPLADHSPCALAAVPVRDSSQQVVAALALCVELTGPNLPTFSNPIGLGGTGYMDLVDMNGVILASTRPERVGQFSDHNTTLAKGIAAQRAFVSRCHSCHTPLNADEPRAEMLAFAPLQNAQWGVTVRQDEQEVLALARDLQWRIFAFGAVAVAGALILVYLTTRSVILPVQALTTATRRIAGGDLETPIQPRGSDEIGNLARSFDAMRSQLRHSISEIQMWNRELDARVQERTAALAAAQHEAQESRDRLAQRNRELSALNAIAQKVGRSLRLDECLALALAQVRRITHMDVGSIFLLEGEDSLLRLRMCYGISEAGAESTARLGLSDVACGGVLQIGKPVVVQNVAQTTRGTRGALRDETLASLVHVPLTAKGRPLGTLCLGTREPYTFSDQEVALLSAIGSQIAIAVENARLYEELSRKEQMRGELLRRIISVQEDERKRIARELHDETSQTLTALLYALDSAANTCAERATAPLLRKMRRLTVSAIDDVHKLIFDLRPTMLDQLGLVAALSWYAEMRFAETPTRAQVSEVGATQRLPSAVETALFRTVQEAINNAARHAGARHLWIRFDFQDTCAQIEVEDDGIGFDVNRVVVSPGSPSGLGLLSMQERMRAVGGEFFLTSALSEGTTILLRVPIRGGGNGSDQSVGGG